VLIHRSIEACVREAVKAVLPEADVSEILLRPCPNPKFGDYQCNSLMALAKAGKMNPRQLATDVVEKLCADEWCEPVEIAGPGFLNFRLKTEAIAAALESARTGEHLFFEKADRPESIVIDFSSPNVAKPMHVGHIRSTILGESLKRIFRLLGHAVVGDNHIGDWGTQFGKLLVGWKEELNREALEAHALEEMERLYKLINDRCESDETTLKRARAELVKLQGGDEENLAIWKEMIALSQSQFDEVYARLGVSFDESLGESFYNDRLKAVVEELKEKDIAWESEGAMCVFSDGSLAEKDDPFLIHRDGEWNPNPAIVLKSDGGANYTTSDLATLEHRLKTWAPDRIIYVTDGRQQHHFTQLFNIFRRWRPEENVRLDHVWFGAILGEDGKPFKTRAGGTIRLTDLLNEAEERGYAVAKGKYEGRDDTSAPSEDAQKEIGRVIGLGGIKYADLSPNRQSDYKFSWERMLSLQGNSFPYLLNAYVRIRSIFRKVNDGASTESATALALTDPKERALAKQMLDFDFVLQSVAEECRPNLLCNYLYELACQFAQFYEACPVLKAEEPQRGTRLALCDLVSRVLKQGLEALGLETTDRM
jgi:arginyl-tRNA synthetase